MPLGLSTLSMCRINFLPVDNEATSTVLCPGSVQKIFPAEASTATPSGNPPVAVGKDSSYKNKCSSAENNDL